jgi:tRNA(Ile)-lysidine synthase
MNHGIRGEESDGDEAFVRDLASQFDLPFQTRSVRTPEAAQANREGLEESARNLRYRWFWELLAENEADAVVTAHTLDDQAETVLHRLVRGAWTEGLSGIHAVLKPAVRHSGLILRPFLSASRAQIEDWLRAIGQPWREDSSNRDTAFTRNRIRHELLPAFAEYNPAIKKQFAQLAALALDEESYWQAELARLLPGLLLSGKAVRGGGRATNTLLGDQSLSIEVERLRPLHPALRRRVLRATAEQLGVSLDFDHTERLLALAGFGESAPEGSRNRKSGIELRDGLRAERTPREIRLFREPAEAATGGARTAHSAEYPLPIPGSVEAPAFGIRLEAAIGKPAATDLQAAGYPAAILRPNRAGDRVTLQHSRSSLKVKEALRRARLPATEPVAVLEWQGEIVWVPGLTVESAPARKAALSIQSRPLA